MSVTNILTCVHPVNDEVTPDHSNDANKFDVKDPKWQVHNNFQPIHESTYTFPLEKDGWVHAHNSIRAEIHGLRTALNEVMARGDGDFMPDWAVMSLQTWWKAHAEHIHGHHTNEDDILNPKLRERFHYPDKLEADHTLLVRMMDELDKLIMTDLKPGGSIDSISAKWDEYSTLMLPHLLEEEKIGLPLARAYFTKKEFSKIISAIMKKATPIELGAFIHAMGEHTFRREFMPQEGIPFFVWFLVMKRCLNAYVKRCHIHLVALESGVPAITNKCSI
jgi:hemerythrin-like domain-containing protein